MKNLLNCHVIGLHSFPLSIDEENKLYRRIFTTTCNHVLHERNSFPLAIHPHHVNIKITVLKGELTNVIYKLDEKGRIELGEYVYESVILNGKGGFKKTGVKNLTKVSEISYQVGESFYMEACEMHTVIVPENTQAAWLVEEELPTCEYLPVSYSDRNLEQWDQTDLYIEIDDKHAALHLKGLKY